MVCVTAINLRRLRGDLRIPIGLHQLCLDGFIGSQTTPLGRGRKSSPATPTTPTTDNIYYIYIVHISPPLHGVPRLHPLLVVNETTPCMSCSNILGLFAVVFGLLQPFLDLVLYLDLKLSISTTPVFVV